MLNSRKVDLTDEKEGMTMAKKNRSKTILISESEVSRFVSKELSALSPEAHVYLERLITDSFVDLLAMAVVQYVNDYPAYEYDEDWEESYPEDADYGLTSIGAITPASYATIADFLNDFNGEVEERFYWGETSYEPVQIERTIESSMSTMLQESLDTFIQQFDLKQQTHPEWVLQQVTVTKQQVRQHRVTDERFLSTVSSFEDIPREKPATSKELNDFLKDYFDSFSGLSVAELLCEWLSDLWKEPFYQIYFRGCELLGQTPSVDFEVIRYTNTPLQQVFYNYLERHLIQHEEFRKSLIPKLPTSAEYQHRQQLLSSFKEKEVLPIKPLLDDLLREGTRSLVLKINESSEEDILKLMAAIYANEFQALSSQSGDPLIEELTSFLSYPEIKEALLLDGLRFSYQSLYPELQMRDRVMEALPSHPKDYFPFARSLNRHFILHVGETNTGKTHQSLERLKQASTGVYLAPLRLLALEVQESLVKEGCPCHLLTGEESLMIEGAQHWSCTIEKLNPHQHYEVAVIDEGQMIGDPMRGQAWTHAILGVFASEVHVCLAPHALSLITSLIESCQDTFEVVTHVRSSELSVSAPSFDFVKDTQPGDALVVFSKRKVLNVAAKLMKERQLACSLLYGALPYKNRAKQFQDFLSGQTQVLVTTDAVGMGVNLPIKRVILLEDRKFDGKEMRKLNTSELKQIGGRAGRKGIYDIGEVLLPTQELVRRFHQTIPSLEVAPVGLTPDLLTIPEDLTKIVEGWMEVVFEKPFKRALIQQSLQRLQLAKMYNLSKEQLYQAMFLPANPDHETQRERLKSYFNHLSQGASRLPFPQKPPLRYDDSLSQLEDYYKLLDLYYAFSKTYGLLCDERALQSERTRVSDLINQQLLASDLKVATCNECGREMAWDATHYKCEHCYQSRYRYYSPYGDWDDEDYFF